MLHSQIQNLILTNKPQQGSPQQHLVLITGDGNENENRTSFPQIVSTALDYGWTIELWSWKASLSAKFTEIQRKDSSKMKINSLDTYRTKITFKQKQQEQQQEQQQQKQQHPTSSSRFWLLPCLGLLCIAFFISYFLNVKKNNE